MTFVAQVESVVSSCCELLLVSNLSLTHFLLKVLCVEGPLLMIVQRQSPGKIACIRTSQSIPSFLQKMRKKLQHSQYERAYIDIDAEVKSQEHEKGLRGLHYQAMKVAIIRPLSVTVPPSCLMQSVKPSLSSCTAVISCIISRFHLEWTYDSTTSESLIAHDVDVCIEWMSSSES